MHEEMSPISLLLQSGAILNNIDYRLSKNKKDERKEMSGDDVLCSRAKVD